jgi:hypothetical protein
MNFFGVSLAGLLGAMGTPSDGWSRPREPETYRRQSALTAKARAKRKAKNKQARTQRKINRRKR